MAGHLLPQGWVVPLVEELMTAFCIVVLFVSAGLTRVFYRRVFNPLLVLAIVWTIAFGFYDLDQRLFRFFRPINAMTSLLFCLSFVSFLVGSVIVVLKHVPSGNTPLGVNSAQLVLLRRITELLIPILCVSLAVKYLLLFQRYGNPFLHLFDIRRDYVTGELKFPFRLDFLSTFTGYWVVLNLGVLAVFQRGFRVKIWIALAVFLVLLADASVAGRGWSLNLFLFLTSTVLVAYNVVLNRRIKARHYAVLLGGMIAFASLITVIFCFRAKAREDFFESLTVDTFQYTVGNISSTGYFVEHPLPTGPRGYYTFGGLLRLADDVFGLFGMSFLEAKESSSYYADILDFGVFNTSTHLAFYYADYGTAGVLVISFVLGFISTYLYVKASLKKRILDIQLSAITFAMLLFSIRGIYSEGRFFWILIFAVFVQHIALSHRNGTWSNSRNYSSRLAFT